MTTATAQSADLVRPNPITSFFKPMLLISESGVGIIGALIVLTWILVAIFAPLLAPFDPLTSIKPMAPLGYVDADTGSTMWLGGDKLGRDVLSRIIYGTRRVLTFATVATVVAYMVGIVFGLAGGYLRGWTDKILSFIANLILAFPVMVLFVLIIAILGASPLNIIFAVTFSTSPLIFRIVRALVLDVSSRDYITASETRGENHWYIMFVDILPNVRGPLIVDFCLRLGYTTIVIGALGFLGLGLPPPDPDWGMMANENRVIVLVQPYGTLFPVLALSSFVLGLNFLADGIREVSLKD